MTKKRWLALALAAVVLGGLGMLFLPGKETGIGPVVRAEYPGADAGPPVEEPPDTSALQPFFAQSARVFLTGERGENRVYSPLNVYMALSVLARATQGESRDQVLSLLGSGDIDALGRQANIVWEANYRDDKTRTCVLANSIWLDESVTAQPDTLERLAREVYVSTYQGEMGSAQLGQALRDWLNEQTGGLLKEQAGDLELDSQAVLALASTVYFRARWYGEFSKGRTRPQTFHTPAGEVETSFMNQDEVQDYYWGEKFSAVSQPFDGGGAMWFLLPGQGVSPEDLLLDPEVVDFLFTPDKEGWQGQKSILVNKSIPRFDIASRFDLEEGLKELGVTGVFDPALADFTPVAAGPAIAITQADHAARVVIDEEGCTAAAYTVMIASGAPPPPDGQADFVLDRPFLFCVTGKGGLPLFVGKVNDPRG